MLRDRLKEERATWTIVHTHFHTLMCTWEDQLIGDLRDEGLIDFVFVGHAHRQKPWVVGAALTGSGTMPSLGAVVASLQTYVRKRVAGMEPTGMFTSLSRRMNSCGKCVVMVALEDKYKSRNAAPSERTKTISLRRVSARTGLAQSMPLK